MKALERIEKITIYTLVFLIPLLVVPSFPNPFATPKLALLALGVSVLTVSKSLKTYLRGSMNYKSASIDTAVFLFALAYLASAIFATPNKMEAFFLPGTASVFILAILLYYFANQLGDKRKTSLVNTLYYSSIVMSIILLLANVGVLSNVDAIPPLFRSQTFTTLGTNLQSIIFLAATLPIGLSFVVYEKETLKKLFWGVSLAVVVLGIAISVLPLLPVDDQESVLRMNSLRASWEISFESVKENPLFGSGPGNYLSAFSKFRPISFNQTDYWNIRFSTASNYVLTAITETGFLGLAALVYLLISISKVFKIYLKESRHTKLAGWGLRMNPSILSLTAFGIALLIFPTGIVTITTVFILLSTIVKGKENKIVLSVPQSQSTSSSKLPATLLAGPVVILVSLFVYYSLQFLSAELMFRRSIEALGNNKANETYNLLREAIAVSPLVDRYHANYAQINLALAQGLAQNVQGEASEEDRNNITQLIQQAIREGKSTVTLNPQRASNWELLSQIYRSLISLASDADKFAIQTYSQAIALDPINPNLRVNLGGLYYSLGDFEIATDVLKLAVATKPDHANSHFNLALAFRENGQLDKAISEMTLVLSLVDSDSPDYAEAKQILEELEAKRPVTDTLTGEELNTPEPINEPFINPPVDLTEDDEPPVAPTATPTPEVEPTGGPSPTLVP